jgi:hypothetical protein
MSLDFMNSSHAKRAYEIVVERKVNRLKKKKDFVLSGGVDDVALNSGQLSLFWLFCCVHQINTISGLQDQTHISFLRASSYLQLSQSSLMLSMERW